MICWRRRRDSNPRYALSAYNGLANRRLQPLGHVSGRKLLIIHWPLGQCRNPATRPRSENSAIGRDTKKGHSALPIGSSPCWRCLTISIPRRLDAGTGGSGPDRQMCCLALVGFADRPGRQLCRHDLWALGVIPGAPRSGRGGRWFKSCHSDQINQSLSNLAFRSADRLADRLEKAPPDPSQAGQSASEASNSHFGILRL